MASVRQERAAACEKVAVREQDFSGTAVCRGPRNTARIDRTRKGRGQTQLVAGGSVIGRAQTPLHVMTGAGVGSRARAAGEGLAAVGCVSIGETLAPARGHATAGPSAILDDHLLAGHAAHIIKGQKAALYQGSITEHAAQLLALAFAADTRLVQRGIGIGNAGARQIGLLEHAAVVGDELASLA
jgi:hypothetical protein